MEEQRTRGERRLESPNFNKSSEPVGTWMMPGKLRIPYRYADTPDKLRLLSITTTKLFFFLEQLSQLQMKFPRPFRLFRQTMSGEKILEGVFGMSLSTLNAQFPLTLQPSTSRRASPPRPCSVTYKNTSTSPRPSGHG